MDAYDAWQSAATVILAVAPWFLPDLDNKWKAIIVLTLLLVSALGYCLRLQKKIKALDLELAKVKENRDALVPLFEEKRDRLDSYINEFDRFEMMLLSALQSTKQDRFKVLYEAFLLIKSNLKNTR